MSGARFWRIRPFLSTSSFHLFFHLGYQTCFSVRGLTTKLQQCTAGAGVSFSISLVYVPRICAHTALITYHSKLLSLQPSVRPFLALHKLHNLDSDLLRRRKKEEKKERNCAALAPFALCHIFSALSLQFLNLLWVVNKGRKGESEE